MFYLLRRDSHCGVFLFKFDAVLKLLYITNGITGSGGLERVLSVKASMLADLYEYQVHILVLNESSTTRPFFRFSEKIIRHSIAADGGVFQYWKTYSTGIKTKVKEINPDVISVCDDGLKGFFVPRILNSNIPVIYERHVSQQVIIHDSNENFLWKILKKISVTVMKKLASGFDAFILLTEGNREEWPPLENIKIIPNPLSFFPVDDASLINKKVIAVGKQSCQKAYDDLLRIWSLLKNRKGWTLEIYGKQEQQEYLEELAEKLQIRESVNFHEPSKNIEEKFKDSSIFAFPSRYEGFGMVLIEAMSSGLPVVSFDCPYGPGDIITDNEDGFLIKKRDFTIFAEKLDLLMKDEHLRIKMGSIGRENAKRYLPETIVVRWDDLFKSLLKNKKVKS